MADTVEVAALEKWIRFRVGKGIFALPASSVDGVVSLAKEKLSPLPLGQTKHILGIFSHRGQVVAVAGIEDMPLPASHFSDDPWLLLLVNSGGRPFAIPVDEVLGLTDPENVDEAKLLRADMLYTGRLG